ncbi:ATP-binding protein [Lysobacter sp. GX 14042]|uniref:ATP-binding protein n=1 Tax=Lysobacter sp. GX 14042 TaxID=2907155 RepID=UPI001F2D86C8|nr:ATP-binding protein [Lysobacter sp. GX 14042]MCE7031890.1 ATP-binding protein [Lysobacter sp. GX 14042]
MPQPRVLGAADGLPSTSVNGIARDREGHVWVATADGLARYDGIGFRSWRHDPGDPRTLPGNYVTVLHVDQADRVWAAVEGRGLSMLDTRREGFRHFHPEADVWAIASRGEAVWYGTFGDGLYRLDAASGAVERFAGGPSGLPADTILALAFDAGGRLWAGTTRGLARFDGQRFQPVPLPGDAPDSLIYSLTAEDEALWIGARSGVYRHLPGAGWSIPQWSAQFAGGNSVFSVKSDGERGYWLASQQALWHAPADGVPYRVPLGTRGAVRPLQQMLRQEDGALWFPVAGVGLGFLRADWRRLAVFSRERGGLQGDSYRDIVPAAAGGLWLLARGGELEHLAADGTLRPVAPRLHAGLAALRPLTLAEDRQGRLWIGGSGQGRLARLDPGTGELLEWTPDDTEDPTMRGPVDHLAIAPDGTLWLASAGAGLQQRDVASGRVVRDIPGGATHGLPAADLEALGFDPEGRLWVAGGFGLRYWDDAAARFRPAPGIAADDRVFAFAFASPQELWLQHLSGLEQYRVHDGRWQLRQRAGAAQGIPPVEGSGLAVDPDGQVWLASMRGLYRWDPGAQWLRRFGLADGLGSEEFLDQGMVLAPGGVLAAALANGSVLLMDTLAPDPPARQPTLALDSLSVRREGAWHPIDPDRPGLRPGDRELRARLSLLAFDDPRATRFQTWLVGHDSGWIGQAGNGERVWAGLSPGDYTLRARAFDAAGNASAERRLGFALPPPWWRTDRALAGWAVLAVLLAFAAMWAVRQRIARRARQRAAARERELALQASQAKSRFLATLGHEVRTPMTGVLGMTELLLDTPLDEGQRARAESIRGAGEHLLRLLDDALDLARIEAGRLELDEAPFAVRELAATVAALVEPLARGRGLAFACDVAADVPAAVRGDATRVRQVLLNLLGNAVKFTERGSIRLELSTAPGGSLRLAVRDTGPGLQPSQVERLFRRFEQGDGPRTAARYGGSGLGLAICQELAAAMGGRIAVESTPGEGTRFEVILPLPAVPLPAPQPPAAQAMRALSLLLVEDDPVVSEVIAGLLRAQGHAVTVAGHGLAAMAEAAVLRFDAALLDLDLPGLDGLSLARHLLAQGTDIPLVAITARADQEAEGQAAQAGFRHFLRKPVTGRHLARALAAVAGEAKTGLSAR